MGKTEEKDPKEKGPSVLSRRILNRTIVGRVYTLRDGRQLEPGAVLNVTPEECAHMVRYHDIVDADKLGPKGKTLSDALKDNEKLRARVSALEASGEDVDKLKAQIDELTKKLEKAGGKK